jgi:hypothetical protein
MAKISKKINPADNGDCFEMQDNTGKTRLLSWNENQMGEYIGLGGEIINPAKPDSPENREPKGLGGYNKLLKEGWKDLREKQ